MWTDEIKYELSTAASRWRQISQLLASYSKQIRLIILIYHGISNVSEEDLEAF